MNPKVESTLQNITIPEANAEKSIEKEADSQSNKEE